MFEWSVWSNPLYSAVIAVMWLAFAALLVRWLWPTAKSLFDVSVSEGAWNWRCAVIPSFWKLAVLVVLLVLLGWLSTLGGSLARFRTEQATNHARETRLDRLDRQTPVRIEVTPTLTPAERAAEAVREAEMQAEERKKQFSAAGK